jgi:hypothetical protein
VEDKTIVVRYLNAHTPVEVAFRPVATYSFRGRPGNFLTVATISVFDRYVSAGNWEILNHLASDLIVV